MSDIFKFEYIEPQNIILNKNKEDRGTYIEGTKSGITLKTLQQPTDITIRSDFYAGNFDSVISVRNSYNTDQFFGVSINSTPEEQYIGDEFVLYRTGFAFTGSFSEGPFIRLGRNNIISEKSNSKLGIGTLFPAEKVHISGGNLRVEGNVFANNLYTNDNPSGFITGVEKQTKLFDYVTGVPIYMYVGSAPFGSSQNDNVWDIYRTEIDQNGLVASNLLAQNATWTGRYFENYM